MWLLMPLSFAVFPLMRFKPLFSAVLRIFLSAEGCGRLAERRFVF